MKKNIDKNLTQGRTHKQVEDNELTMGLILKAAVAFICGSIIYNVVTYGI